MSQTAVLVWLSAASALPTFRADLDAFAQSRLVRFEAPRENAAAFHASAYAPDVVAQVESSLEEARNATASLEQSRAQSALERADHLLHEHPELPQAAWLMAEVLQLSADIENTAPEGADAATLLRQRAAALEGPRAVPFSPVGDYEARQDRTPSSEPAQVVSRKITVDGLEPEDTLQWDGLDAQSPIVTAPGEHHARVLRRGRLLWAGWAQLGSVEAELRLPVPKTVTCSSDDIGQGHFSGGRALPAPHARCESYVLARARSGGGIEAALCERESCGQVVIWEHPSARDTAHPAAKRVWPYALALSAGALAVTGLVLWRAGVFDRPEATTTSVWVANPKQMALSF
ncbi:MAG TPA: hypothetical protein VGL19_11115 [Polyangiaceae bacterium]|jgi:hypothetical protein